MVMKGVHWEQSPSVTYDNERGEFVKIKQTEAKMCAFS